MFNFFRPIKVSTEFMDWLKRQCGWREFQSRLITDEVTEIKPISETFGRKFYYDSMRRFSDK